MTTWKALHKLEIEQSKLDVAGGLVLRQNGTRSVILATTPSIILSPPVWFFLYNCLQLPDIMTSILRRPFDLLIVLVFVTFFTIAITIGETIKIITKLPQA